MYVGVILVNTAQTIWQGCIPHVCGGDPVPFDYAVGREEYSPCMWG